MYTLPQKDIDFGSTQDGGRLVSIFILTEEEKMSKKKKVSHLLFYVENCDSKVRRFYDKKKLASFVAKFLKKYPMEDACTHGSWIDYGVFDIAGDIVYFTDEYDVIE